MESCYAMSSGRLYAHKSVSVCACVLDSDKSEYRSSFKWPYQLLFCIQTVLAKVLSHHCICCYCTPNLYIDSCGMGDTCSS